MKYILSLCALLVATSTFATGKPVKLKGIKIKADNEAPQVMHIIPWQTPEGAERLYTPVRGVHLERLKPLDPYTFELEQTLHNQWQANKQADLVGQGH